jgi:hypothetical protein
MNRFLITMNFPYTVNDSALLELLIKFNEFLQTYNNGYYGNVNVILEEVKMKGEICNGRRQEGKTAI